MAISGIVAVAGRIGRLRRRRGILATARFLSSRIFRHEIHLVYESRCSGPRTAVEWNGNEQLLHFGPENIDMALTPQLWDFLGGEDAFESLHGVRNGDRLFVVTNGEQYLHRGYIIFKTRQSKLLGDEAGLPLIGYCSTIPSARGRGLYRRALEAEVCYLHSIGHGRVLIETAPENHASLKGIEAAGFTFSWSASIWITLNLLVVRRIRNAPGQQWHVFLL